jgi:hypothetical protein
MRGRGKKGEASKELDKNEGWEGGENRKYRKLEKNKGKIKRLKGK